MFCLLFFVLMAHTAYGEVSYSFPEEMKRGFVIGNIAKDLGLDVNRLSSRKARIDTEGNRKRYCDINLNTGELIVAERIDREEISGKKASCVIKNEFVLENPLELHHFILNIEDINDNSPQFKESVIKFEIRESAGKGSSYLLEEAYDADIGRNAVQSYTLQNNEHFILNVLTRANGRKYGQLVLNKELDREEQTEVTLILTAVDGGTPPRSGTVAIHVTVLDANDNHISISCPWCCTGRVCCCCILYDMVTFVHLVILIYLFVYFFLEGLDADMGGALRFNVSFLTFLMFYLTLQIKLVCLF
uniref:Cadherin domain-containing protein n=1 Tax=Sinocyclocheilus anshuiensis TaxID=1608454 RepID=A0A671PAN9_9TELE